MVECSRDIFGHTSVVPPTPACNRLIGNWIFVDAKGLEFQFLAVLYLTD